MVFRCDGLKITSHYLKNSKRRIYQNRESYDSYFSKKPNSLKEALSKRSLNFLEFKKTVLFIYFEVVSLQNKPTTIWNYPYILPLQKNDYPSKTITPKLYLSYPIKFLLNKSENSKHQNYNLQSHYPLSNKYLKAKFKNRMSKNLLNIF